jgi:hypothetical protein
VMAVLTSFETVVLPGSFFRRRSMGGPAAGSWDGLGNSPP